MNQNNKVKIFTDGACSGNPGPGGWGAILRCGDKEVELSGGEAATTNNRMELTAAIEALARLTRPCTVTLQTDSRYVVDGIEKGWAKNWRRNNWTKSDKKPALNPDLWEKLLNLCEIHEVTFTWIKGHAGHAENERCDQLAREKIPR
ncbi:MAG: ribonuclease HI [Oscillospiraceae bacterium]|nr:ribonuclease HI [Oscillospiraceae bacterium]